jgi:hypothetical protein
MSGRSFMHDQFGSVAVSYFTVPFTVHNILSQLQKYSEEAEFRM